tara:strand:- start:2587 stop:3462 length:876 start_codon:yes stop_codon:yes gene_type:complete
MENTRTILKGLISLSIGAALLGFSAIFVRISETSPSTTAFYRAFLALPFLYLWIYFSREAINWNLDRRTIYIFLVSGIFFGADMAVWNWSIQFTSVAHATLLANTAPIFVTLIAFTFLKQKISKSFFFFLLLAMSGVYLVISSGSGGNEKRLFGDYLGIAAAVFYAGYILSVKRLTDQIPPSQVLFFSTLVTALFLFPISFIESDSLFPGTSEGWSILFGYALVSQVIGSGLITFGISKLSAHLSSLVLLIQPVAAAVFGWIILSENLISTQIFGGLIVLVAIYLASTRSD